MTTAKAAASILREKAELLRLLGHPIRLAILQKLAHGPKCVTDIQDILEVAQPNISQHLSVLRSHRIVGFHEDGKLRCYYITRPAIAEIVQMVLGTETPVVERAAEDVRRAGSRAKPKKCTT